MPAPLSRLGDTNQTGGQILRGSVNTFCNGRPVGLHPSPISPHFPFKKFPNHIVAFTVTFSPTVICNGSPVLKVGSLNTCFHSIITGSLNTIVP